eukprot:762760-Hanusia_phi.AAC.18
MEPIRWEAAAARVVGQRSLANLYVCSAELWKVYESLARTQKEHRELENALESYKKCMEFARQKERQDKQFFYHNQVGEILFQLGDHLGAISSHSQAADIARRSEIDKLQLTDCRLRMAFNHMRLKDFRAAHDLFESCYQDYVETYGPEHPNSVTTRGQLDLCLKQRPQTDQ